MNARIDKRYGSIAWKKLRSQILARATARPAGRTGSSYQTGANEVREAAVSR